MPEEMLKPTSSAAEVMKGLPPRRCQEAACKRR